MKRFISVATIVMFAVIQFAFPLSIASAQSPQPSQPEQEISRLYIPTSDHTVLVKNNDETTLIVQDYLSSTRVELTDSPQSHSYLAYGGSTELDQSQDRQDALTDKAFTGHRLLPQTPVYHAGARMYNPTLGMFVQADRAEGPNRYIYGNNNPVSFHDPTGEFAFLAAFAVLGLIAFLSTTPIKESTVYPNPQFDANASEWEATGGPAFSVAAARMNPLIGLPAAGIELGTGRDIYSNTKLSGFQKFANGLEIVGSASGLAFLNKSLGRANSVTQASRVSAYDHGSDLLNASTVGEAEDILRKAVPEIEFGYDFFQKGSAKYDPKNVRIMYRGMNPSLTTVKHEGVHALQFNNGKAGVVSRQSNKISLQFHMQTFIRPKSEYNLSSNLALMRYNAGQLPRAGRLALGSLTDPLLNPLRGNDLEMMAYGSTETYEGILRHYSGSFWSTSVLSGSKNMNRASGLVRKADNLSSDNLVNLGRAIYSDGKVFQTNR